MKIKKIKQFIDEFSLYSKKVNPTILASSMSFYVITIFIPIITIVLSILSKLDIAPFQNYEFPRATGWIATIILIFNMLWISSSLINAMSLFSDIVYISDSSKRITWKRRAISFLLIIAFIIIIVTEICIMLFIVYFLRQWIPERLAPLLAWIQFILQFLGIVLLNGLIYKYIIPIKVKVKYTMMIGLLVTAVWYIITYGYRLILRYFGSATYDILYGSIANIFILLAWLYLICTVFIYGLICNYYVSKRV